MIVFNGGILKIKTKNKQTKKLLLWQMKSNLSMVQVAIMTQ